MSKKHWLTGWQVHGIIAGDNGHILVTFKRSYRPRRSLNDERPRWNHITVEVEADGLTRVSGYNGRTVGLKPHVRARCHDVAVQALAYVVLTGTAEGFPEQETLL